MKESKKIFILFVFGLLATISCENTPSSDLVDLNISFVVFDVFKEDSLVVQPDVFSIEGLEVNYSVINGYSANLTPGQYPINLRSSYHQSLDTLITITESTESISLEMKHKMVPYFTLNLGERWEFEYLNTVTPPNDGPTKKMGLMSWEIIKDSTSIDTGDSIYLVRSFLEGKRTRENLGGGLIDSSKVNEISHFTITLKKNGEILYSQINNLSSLGPVSLTSGISAIYLNGEPRQMPVFQSFPASITSANPLLKVEYGSSIISSRIAPETGFYQYYIYNMGNTKTSTSLSLISHSK